MAEPRLSRDRPAAPAPRDRSASASPRRPTPSPDRMQASPPRYRRRHSDRDDGHTRRRRHRRFDDSDHDRRDHDRRDHDRRDHDRHKRRRHRSPTPDLSPPRKYRARRTPSPSPPPSYSRSPSRSPSRTPQRYADYDRWRDRHDDQRRDRRRYSPDRYDSPPRRRDRHYHRERDYDDRYDRRPRDSPRPQSDRSLSSYGSPPRRRRLRRNRRDRRRRDREPVSPSQRMAPDLVDTLFLDALKLVVKYRRPPFNISIISDYMSELNHDWSVRKTQYPTFSDLCREQENRGHLVLGRKGESVVMESSKYEPQVVVPRPRGEGNWRRRKRERDQRESDVDRHRDRPMHPDRTPVADAARDVEWDPHDRDQGRNERYRDRGMRDTDESVPHGNGRLMGEHDDNREMHDEEYSASADKVSTGASDADRMQDAPAESKPDQVNGENVNSRQHLSQHDNEADKQPESMQISSSGSHVASLENDATAKSGEQEEPEKEAQSAAEVSTEQKGNPTAKDVGEDSALSLPQSKDAAVTENGIVEGNDLKGGEDAPANEAEQTVSS